MLDLRGRGLLMEETGGRRDKLTTARKQKQEMSQNIKAEADENMEQGKA